MSKKTIGGFIAALRRAKGMTQRELADKLNVSDKSVSRWEREETAPDLLLIPVIADIFNITADELLRGERMRGADEETEPQPVKSKRQLEYLLKQARAKHNVQSIIALGIGMMGFVAALLCNFGFYRAVLGFCIACAFYLCAIICEICFVTNAVDSVNADELTNEEAVLNTRKSIIRRTVASLSTIIILLSITLPLIALPAGDVIGGLNINTWAAYAIPFILAGMVVCIIASFATDFICDKKGIYKLAADEPCIRKRKLKYCRAAVGLLVITILIQAVFNSAVTPSDFAKGRVFTAVEEFIKYMETPSQGEASHMEASHTMVSDNDEPAEPEYYEELYAEDGSVIGRFRPLNNSVSYIQYKVIASNQFLAETFTFAEFAEGAALFTTINRLFMLLYIIELLVISRLLKKSELYKKVRRNVLIGSN